jgi:hypothetical protein
MTGSGLGSVHFAISNGRFQTECMGNARSPIVPPRATGITLGEPHKRSDEFATNNHSETGLIARTKTDNLISQPPRPIIPATVALEMLGMAANRVVLRLDEQEHSLLFTLAASSVMPAEPPAHPTTQLARWLLGFRKPVELLRKVF